MAKKCRSFLLLCLPVLMVFCIGCARVAPSAPSDQPIIDRIDAWVLAKMRADHVPGLALGIVKGDTVFYLKGYGIADPSGRAVTVQTPFVLASVSKSITALAVLQLVQGSNVGLDTPVNQYLPALQLADPAMSGRITVRQLLNQTSGLSTYTGNLLNDRNGGKPLDELAAQLRSARLVSQPGVQFHYSNANYVLLADVVEHVSGLPYSRYVRERIFQLLSMGSSSVEHTSQLQGNLAAGYQLRFGIPTAVAPYQHVAFLHNISTAEDMTHFLMALLNGGSYNGVSVCSSSTVSMMQQPAAKMSSGKAYAMGLEVNAAKPYALIMHPGDAPEYNANIALLPEQQWGIVVLENVNWLGMAGETNGIISGIEDILQGREPTAQPFGLGTLSWIFDGICAITLIFMIRAFLRLGRLKASIEQDSGERIRRRLIPVMINNVCVPICLWVFVPMAFSANWEMGFLNGPDFALFIISLIVLLLVLGVVKACFIFWRMASIRKAAVSPA